MNKDEIKNGIKIGFPIVIGYAPVAATFGLVCKSAGFSLLKLLPFRFLFLQGQANLWQ